MGRMRAMTPSGPLSFLIDFLWQVAGSGQLVLTSAD
jgi:hypothetical protein